MILGHDEHDMPEGFKVPEAAIRYGTGQASVRDEERIDRVKDKLIAAWFKRCDHTEVAIHDLEDKIKAVERFHRIKKYV